jgi:dipeptidyl aminopeptidase/acylaminoacyl peptidase
MSDDGEIHRYPRYDVERYLNVRSAYGGSLGPEGDRLAFLVDTTGTAQVWSVGGPTRWPEQHTFYEDGVTFCSWSPERPELVFGIDEGGNERAQLHLLDPDTGGITDLTRHPDAKHYWGGWSDDGHRFAFASNRRDVSTFDVYVQGRDEVGDEATLVHEGDPSAGSLSAAGWSPDDDRLLVHEAHASFDHELHVLELDSGELRQVTPEDDDPVRYRSVEWSPDGRSVYLVTDRDADTLYLARLDLDAGDLSTVETGGEWNVDGVAVDGDTGRLVYSRNVDGYTELTTARLGGEGDDPTDPSDPDVLAGRATVDLPRGVAGGVSFGPDAERFSITVTGRTENTNVHVVDATTGGTERWTDAGTAGIPRETFVEPELVRYPTFDDRGIPAFFSLPGEAKSATDDGAAGAGDGVPVVVDVHGGPESQRRPSFSPVKQYLIRSGYAVFEPNVRGSSGYGSEYTHLDDVEKRMDSVKDLRAGADWLADHPAVDLDRIAVMGGSYGGFMTLAAMTEYPDLWAAGVDVVGIANFVTFLENTGEWRRELREVEYGSLVEDREFLESISPINRVDRISAPLFVIHGENDPRVPVGEAHQIVEEAREQGVPVRELIFEDEGHGVSKLENRIETYTAVVEFLDEHVRNR